MVTQISDWNDLDSAIQGTNGSNETGDFELVSNLDKDTAGYAGIGDDWTPCGENATGNRDSGFEGTFDGKGHVIRDLIIKDSGINEENIGLFGETGDNVTIKNLTVDGEISTSETGGDANFYGMIVGLAHPSGATIKNCVAAGRIEGADLGNVGGLIGVAESGTISDCYSLVDLSCDIYVGGFVSINRTTIERCYAAGNVAGNDLTAGFCASDTGAETDCFWDTEATGQSTSDGNATGLTTSEMQGSSASSNLTGFDFSNDWKTVVGGSNSDIDGYPYLRGLSVHAQSTPQEARFGPFSVTVTGTNSPVNADGTLTVDIDITNNGSFEGEADVELIVEEA